MITIFLPILLLDILILIIYVDSPLSLQSQCRLTVRRAMGGSGLAARVDQDQKQTNWKILELGETMDTVCVCMCVLHLDMFVIFTPSTSTPHFVLFSEYLQARWEPAERATLLPNIQLKLMVLSQTWWLLMIFPWI